MSSTERRRLLVEGVVIVISILLAFSLDALWDYRGNLEEEVTLLQSLSEEFRANQTLLAETMEAVVRNQADIEALIAMSPREAGALSGEEAWRHLDATWRPHTYELASGVITSALATGGLALIRDDDLRTLIAGWPGRAEDIRERAAVMIQQEAHVQAEIDRVAGSQRVEVLGPSTAPRLLEGVRGDQKAMAIIARKQFQAGVYRNEIRGLKARLDTIVAALSGT